MVGWQRHLQSLIRQVGRRSAEHNHIAHFSTTTTTTSRLDSSLLPGHSFFFYLFLNFLAIRVFLFWSRFFYFFWGVGWYDVEFYFLFFLAGELSYLPRLWKLPSANVSTRPFYQFLQQAVMLIHHPPLLVFCFCYIVTNFLNFILFFMVKWVIFVVMARHYLLPVVSDLFKSNLMKY